MTDEARTVEVAHNLSMRNVFINLDDLPKWQKNQMDVDLYSSYFRYYTDDPNVGGVLGGFGMDFDDAENPRRAQKEALLIAKFFMGQFGVKEEDMSVCFSGNKGFHVFINRRVFDVQPHYYLPQIFKQMAKELIQQHGLKTLDLAIYDRRRLIRLPNTRHDTSQLYKIPLTLRELETLNLDQIKAEAVRSRRPPARVEHEPAPKAVRWLQQHQEQFIKKLEGKRIEFTDVDFQTKDLLPCIKKRLELGAEEGFRNKYAWQLASYFCKKGGPLEECLSILRGWYSGLKPGINPYSWQECETTIRKTYDVGGYGIGCGSEYVEGLCVGKENCPLFVKREETEFSEDILQKAEKILESDPLEYIAKTINKIHVGDRDLLKIAYISALSAQLAKPINLWPIGTSQKGKSHSLYSVYCVLPDEIREIFTSASPKSLFYYAKKYGENCFDGKLIFIDEIETSKLTLPMLRSLTGPTDIEPRHLSVYEAEILDLKIKGPRVVWFTSMKAFGADQLRNRFIFVNPDESVDQDDRVFELQKTEDPDFNPEKDPEFQAGQAITKKILEETRDLKVEIPYINKIEWPYKEMRWLFPVFKSFIECNAKIHYKQREREGENIVSTSEDFEITKELWKGFANTIIFRVSDPAKSLLDKLPENIGDAKTKAELAEEIEKSTRQIARLLDELEESGLINKQKRQREGSGRLAWEYWQTKIPNVEDIKLNERDIINWLTLLDDVESPILDISDTSLEGSKKILKKNEESQSDVQNVRNSKVAFEEAEDFGICEVCGYDQAGFWALGLREKRKTRVCYKCRQQLEKEGF